MPENRTKIRAVRAFTLIEILVVVAIISILAAIAVPNFTEAQMRSKIARVRNDQRVIAGALETYFTDHARYPLRNLYNPSGGAVGSFFLGADVTRRAEDLSAVTSPIAYISSLPVDLFEKRVAAPNNLIEYLSPVLVQFYRGARPSLVPSGSFNYEAEKFGNTSFPFGWALISVGPDSLMGYPLSVHGNYNLYGVKANYSHWFREYDPTNGTHSDGNIYRFQKQGATAHNAFFK